MRMLLPAAAALAVACLAAPAATAATPEQGEVSASSLETSWSGEAYGQPMKADDVQTHQLCIDPFCDSFTLTVKDAGALRVDMIAPDSASYVDVLVTLPDGSTEFYTGNETDVFQQITYNKAPLGTYTFDIWPNEIIGLFDGQYTGEAELCLAPQKPSTCFLEEEEEDLEGA